MQCKMRKLAPAFINFISQPERKAEPCTKEPILRDEAVLVRDEQNQAFSTNFIAVNGCAHLHDYILWEDCLHTFARPVLNYWNFSEMNADVWVLCRKLICYTDFCKNSFCTEWLHSLSKALLFREVLYLSNGCLAVNDLKSIWYWHARAKVLFEE